MNNKDARIFLIVGILLLLLFLGGVAYFERKKRKEAEEANVRLLQDCVAKGDLSKEVKQQLENLIERYKTSAPEIVSELSDALVMVENKLEQKACLSISKILEDILVKKYKKDVNFKTWVEESCNVNAKKATYSHFLKYARKNKFIRSVEYYFAEGLRDIRNIEAHKVGIKENENLLYSALLTGIDLIPKLNSIA